MITSRNSAQCSRFLSLMTGPLSICALVSPVMEVERAILTFLWELGMNNTEYFYRRILYYLCKPQKIIMEEEEVEVKCIPRVGGYSVLSAREQFSLSLFCTEPESTTQPAGPDPQLRGAPESAQKGLFPPAGELALLHSLRHLRSHFFSPPQIRGFHTWRAQPELTLINYVHRSLSKLLWRPNSKVFLTGGAFKWSELPRAKLFAQRGKGPQSTAAWKPFIPGQLVPIPWLL